jgi:hypothetical protein
MTILIQDITATATPTPILRLNPISDPPDGACPLPFSSPNTFNGPPGKETQRASLSQFTDHLVQIIFRFDTMDGNYNAFEGWYVDNIAITSSTGNVVFHDNVESGNMGWTVSGSHGISPGWHITGRRAAEFGQAWWYGNDATGTYQTP